jgi:hypothetical protein
MVFIINVCVENVGAQVILPNLSELFEMNRVKLFFVESP